MSEAYFVGGDEDEFISRYPGHPENMQPGGEKEADEGILIGGSPVVVSFDFAVAFELIASAGAEKAGPVQCTANNDSLIHWDSLDDAIRMAVTGGHLYRLPLDGGFGSLAPDANDEGVRLATNLSNAGACSGWSRESFTIGIRVFLTSAGLSQHDLWEQWTAGPKITYNAGGTDTMVFNFPGVPGTSITLPGIDENQLVTVLMGFDFDNLQVHAAIYGEDGTTLIDSGFLDITSLISTGNILQLQSGFFHVKRAIAIDEWLPVGAKRTDLLTRILTDDPLPVTP